MNAFAKRLSFFFYVHMDLFEEVAKFRAGRRLWAKLLRDRYGVTDEKALRFRFGVVCGGSSLTAAQPQNNIVRVGIETLAAVMGGAQSVFTCAFDEAYQIPTETSAEIALRTQQIVAHESGVARTVDPLGGSYYTEWLTDRMEEEIMRIMREVDDYGGVVKAIEDGYLQSQIAERAKERKQATDSGARPVVGVNVGTARKKRDRCWRDVHQDPETVRHVTEKYERVMADRDNAAVGKTLSPPAGGRPHRRRERHAPSRRMLPRLRHGGRDGRRAQGGMGRIPGTHKVLSHATR